ncbi:radical SAM family heme chaperone HemW [Conexibacter sp. JD483]|uniref:radical SAM family heme chaperone HemW n=1 Tax=unclassified Conexibacter TaxID=2627773 RepID=UPI002722F643|nr:MULTISPECIES: radical SAM family heme chaperone HemW [unclassified Conexibacter]MDO8187422.1 radical SAM family heme chaperone HemW [Conexibacter sp. CPCC 205706]MDO8201017.1 radical SAM family heme chaperone HemW [Conexibacter sp. CPCC 205762]MDR9370304.1 radical SAM family heme chaperone HemW [Conexibacter sp. JD483]
MAASLPAAPDAAAPPADGALPAAALAELGRRPLAIYVHVPFCATRCGYCDFNTYTAEELPGGVGRGSYAATAISELRLARAVLGAGEAPVPQVETVFVGGGTPTLLAAGDLAAILAAIDEQFGLAPGAEVTTEANPESVSPESFSTLRAAGFTRVSLGMQSAVPHVLATLDRTHTPGRPAAAAAEARAAGFEHVSLDLIYGTPGESDDDWRASVEAALAAGPDHVSAYALGVEPGTRLHARVRRGELPLPDEDQLADRYAIADELLAAAGLRWYEISNWARSDGDRCAHNLNYWRGADWWGVGPGAHSHVGGVRWWNVLHPSAYARALSAGRSPAAGRELLDAETRRFERIMLETRLREGLDTALLRPDGLAAARRAAADGLASPEALAAGRVLLTRAGRLLADALVRDLVD